MRRAVCIGECMVELRRSPAGELVQGFAGDAYNTAVYLARSAPGLEVQFLTALGDDPFSRDMREAWRAEGVRQDYAFTLEGKKPGLYLIETDPQGERRFHYWRGESAARNWFQVLQAKGEGLLHGADLVYLSGISLAILSPSDRAGALEMLGRLRGRVGLIAFDPNYRPSLWPDPEAAREASDQAMACADIVLPSSEDLEQLYGLTDAAAQLDRLQMLGAGEIALTAGVGRCWLQLQAERICVEGAVASSVIDTSGAGDSFNGAYLAARLRGAPAQDAARAGLELAARVVAAPGAVISRTLPLESH
jgi:2-dehydro-3-deoxygluconokinase